MDNESPVTGQHIQRVEVNGLTYHEFSKLSTHLHVGSCVELMRDRHNTHDKRATKVCLAGSQVGWVPQACNTDLAARLDRGEKLIAIVTRCDPSKWVLTINVYTIKKAEEGSKGPEGRIYQFGPPSNDPHAFERFKKLPVGTVMRTHSTTARSSVSLLDALGSDMAWFRKSDPAFTDRFLKLSQGHKLWARVVVNTSARFEVELLANDQLWDQPNPEAVTVPTEKISEGRITASHPNYQYIPKEKTMNLNNTISNTVNFNKTAAGAAAYLEAGRIANNKVGQLASKGLPLMVRGYADTAVGKLVIANIAAMAAAQLRPQDATLQKLTMAMTTAAYQEVIQNVDIEGMLDSLLSSPDIQRAINKLPKDDADGSKFEGRPGAL